MNKYEKEGRKKEGSNKQGSKEGEGIVQENIKAYQVYEQSELWRKKRRLNKPTQQQQQQQKKRIFTLENCP